MTTYNERLIITRQGGPEVLELIREELPPPGPEQAQIRVQASGVAFGDVLKREGLTPGMPRFPYTPGYDLAGTIQALGGAVSDWQPGRRVTAFVLNGGNARFANVPASFLVPIPDQVDTESAACLTLNYVSAYQMLFRVARLKRDSGATILVHGGAGGAGTAFLDLARNFGIKALATASRGKHEVVRGYGATPIDYKAEDFVAQVLREQPQGVDAVFDPIGGAHVARSWKCLKRDGTLVVFGASEAVTHGSVEFLKTFARIVWFKLAGGSRKARFYGISVRPHSSMRSVRDDLTLLMGLLAQAKLKPLIGARLPFAKAIEAHRMIAASPVAGKILLVSD